MFVPQLLERQKDAHKVAITQGDKNITYSQWYAASQEISLSLSGFVQAASKCVAIFLPNSINYAVAYFSILLAGRIVVPIDTKARAPEVRSTLQYCEIDYIVTSQQEKELLLNLLSQYPHKVVVLCIDTKEETVLNECFPSVPKSGLPVMEGTPHDVAIMLHTSGTTSNPKRVMLTHNNLIKNVESNVKSLNLTADDKVLIALPMYFGYCNTAQFLTHIYLGGSMVILEGLFLPKLFFKTVESEKVTNFTGVPSMLLMLLDYRYAHNYDISSLRFICFGGGKMPVEHLKALISKFNTVSFVQTYGQTEAAPRLTALLSEDALRKVGSVGKPIPHVKIKIVDEDGNEVPNNVMGEIVVQGENVMKGYYKAEAITAQTIVNGWLHTGDLGYLDDEQFLYLVGRKKNMLISGGINVYPEEIEEILLQHPAVKEVCIVGKDHDLLGEIPVARVVLKEDSAVNEDELREYCVANLSSYKVPKEFEFYESLPKTYNGKIRRF